MIVTGAETTVKVTELAAGGLLAPVTVNLPADFQLKDVDEDPGHEFEHTLVALCGKGASYTPVLGGYPAPNSFNAGDGLNTGALQWNSPVQVRGPQYLAR